MEFANTKCNLCGKNNYKTILKAGVFTIVKCKHCGLVYMNPQPNKKELQKLYRKDYFIGKGFDKTVNYLKESIEKPRGENNKIKTKLWYIKKFTKGKKLLDVGCAYGLFLEMAKRKGYNVVGTDISEAVIEHNQTILNIPTFKGVLEEINFKSNHFDVITMTEVVEHLSDPFKTFQEVYRILKEDGIFVVETVNINSLKARIAGKNWDYFILPGHIHYFSKKTLISLLKKADFEVKYMIPPHDFRECKTYQKVFPILKRLHLNQKIINLLFKLTINSYDNLLSSGMIIFAGKRVCNEIYPLSCRFLKEKETK